MVRIVINEDAIIKTLTLIRHAKSSWDDPAVSDKERPLNRRGMKDAPRLGQKLAEHGSKPGLILSSPATRAISTARIIAEHVGYPVNDIIVLDGLYEAAAADLQKVVDGLDESVGEVIVFGHNPGLSALAAHYSAGKVKDLPTSGAAEFQFDVKKWSNTDKVLPVHVWFNSPKSDK